MVWVLLWLIGLTWRFEVIAEEGVTPVVSGQKAGPEIYCFWHQCVLPCAMYFRTLGRGDSHQPQLRRRTDHAHPEDVRLRCGAWFKFAWRAAKDCWG